MAATSPRPRSGGGRDDTLAHSAAGRGYDPLDDPGLTGEPLRLALRARLLWLAGRGPEAGP